MAVQAYFYFTFLTQALNCLRSWFFLFLFVFSSLKRRTKVGNKTQGQKYPTFFFFYLKTVVKSASKPLITIPFHPAIVDWGTLRSYGNYGYLGCEINGQVLSICIFGGHPTGVSVQTPFFCSIARLFRGSCYA